MPKYWIGVVCATCSASIRLFHTDKEGIRIEGEGAKIRTKCPNCGVTSDYPVTDLHYVLKSEGRG